MTNLSHDLKLYIAACSEITSYGVWVGFIKTALSLSSLELSEVVGFRWITPWQIMVGTSECQDKIVSPPGEWNIIKVFIGKKDASATWCTRR